MSETGGMTSINTMAKLISKESERGNKIARNKIRSQKQTLLKHPKFSSAAMKPTPESISEA